MEEHLKVSFEPLADPKAEVLILGSMPGDRSLQLQQYYAHPQNRFWHLVAELTHTEPPTNYEQKKQLLAEHKIALWDVAHQALRPGSLDSAMSNESPNDIARFLATHPRIRTIGFNGKKAEQLYDRHFERLPHLRYVPLPSTSPANASCRFDELCRKWSTLFCHE